MISKRVFTYVCGFCEKPSEIQESRIAGILACPHCGQVLYEIDDQYKRIRVTKNFRIFYRELLQALKDLRTVSRSFENFASGKVVNDSGSLAIPADLSRYADLIRSLSSKLLNENEFSDSDTRDSVSGAVTLIISQSDRLRKAAEISTADENALSHAQGIRSAEKEIFAFIRMLDKYLHERSDLLL